VLLIEKLNLTFDQESVFSDFSFSLSKGESALITGPSGRGKTSLFSAILGFVQPQSGSIYFENQLLSHSTVDLIRSQIGYIAQNPFPLQGPVEDKIKYIFSFSRNQSLRYNESEITDLLEEVGISHSVLKKNAEDLSGGQKQRLALVIAYMLKRKLYLLDEPTSALDQESRSTVINFIEKNFPAALIISHDPALFPYIKKVISL
jgi:putative ABC transport system ATP-binding protein